MLVEIEWLNTEWTNFGLQSDGISCSQIHSSDVTQCFEGCNTVHRPTSLLVVESPADFTCCPLPRAMCPYG